MAVYDDQKQKSDSANPLVPNDSQRVATRSSLQKLEGSIPHSGSVTASNSKDQGVDKTIAPKSLQNAEVGSETASSSGVGGNVSAQFGGGFYKGESSNTKTSSGKVRQLVSNSVRGRRKFIVGGAGGGAIALLLFFGFAAIVPYELVHIEKNLLGYESKDEQHVEKKAAQHLMQKMICWQLKVGCKNNPSDNNKPTAAEEATAEANGEELTDEMDSFKLTNPAIEADLAKQGISVETDGSGNLTGLENSQGQDITEEVGTNDAVFNSIEAAVPEWNVGQEISFRPTMAAEAGASFDILSDTDNKNAQEEIDDAIDNGANAEDIATANAEEEDSTPPDKNASSTDVQAYQDSTAASGQLEAAINKVEADEANGMSEEASINDAASSFDVGTALLWSAIATSICEVKEVADTAAKDRIPTIITALVRHATTTFSLADQLKTGQVTGQEINQTMQIFNGDSSASPTNSDGTANEAALPFSASAAWQRTTGGQVTSSTPDIDPSAKPTANAGQQVVDEINQLFNYLPGANFTCSILTSRWGILAQIGLGVIQIGATVFSGGDVDAGSIAAGTAANTFLQRVVIPDVIKYFTPVGISGHEDSAQWYNNADAGANLAFGNYSRRIGSTALTNDQANTATAEINNEDLADASHLSWTNRTFALSNPDSLVSHLANDLPLGLANTVSGIVGYVSRLPANIFHSIASIFMVHTALAQASPTNPGEPYGVTQYSFMDSEIDKYDPISNEQYLFSTVSYDGNSMKRIDMLGNPNTYTDNPSGDSNNADLLHCFVDSYAIIEEANPNFNPNEPAASDPGADQNCGVIGMYDYANDSPNATDTPNDSTVAQIYCTNLAPFDSGCPAGIAPQINDDVGHFRQYLLDTHVMADYTSLTNNQ